MGYQTCRTAQRCGSCLANDQRLNQQSLQKVGEPKALWICVHHGEQGGLGRHHHTCETMEILELQRIFRDDLDQRISRVMDLHGNADQGSGCDFC